MNFEPSSRHDLAPYTLPSPETLVFILRHGINPCGLYVIRFLQPLDDAPCENTLTISCFFIGLFFASRNPFGSFFTHIQSYFQPLMLLSRKYEENGSFPKRHIALSSLIILLYCISKKKSIEIKKIFQKNYLHFFFRWGMMKKTITNF